MSLDGIIFDLDGTVVEAPYDWPAIRSALGTRGQPILSHLSGLAEPERARKWKILEDIEWKATRLARLKEGIPEFLSFLAAKKIKTALVTNNSGVNMDYLLKKFSLRFDFALSRDSGLWKPSAGPLLAAMAGLKIDKYRCAVIGDSPLDVQAAEEAGIARIYLLAPNGRGPDISPARICSSIQEVRQNIEGLIS